MFLIKPNRHNNTVQYLFEINVLFHYISETFDRFIEKSFHIGSLIIVNVKKTNVGLDAKFKAAFKLEI